MVGRDLYFSSNLSQLLRFIRFAEADKFEALGFVYGVKFALHGFKTLTLVASNLASRFKNKFFSLKFSYTAFLNLAPNAKPSLNRAQSQNLPKIL